MGKLLADKIYTLCLAENELVPNILKFLKLNCETQAKTNVDTYNIVFLCYSLSQACQTQTILWAAKATKTAEGATKVPKNPSASHI
jgi:hypothetical protein